MSYVSAETGKEITELEHVEQSLRDLLTTRKKSRVMLMEYGTDLYLMLDKPVDRELIADVRMEVANAIDRWEPRLELKQIKMDMTQLSQGVIIFDLTCIYKPTGKVVEFSNLDIRYRSIEA